MAYPIATGSTVSLTTGLKTADLIVGKNKYIGKGRLVMSATQSALAAGLGIRATLNCGGAVLCDDAMIPYAAATGAMISGNCVLVDQVVAGGCVELFLRNDAAGTLTADYVLYFTPM